MRGPAYRVGKTTKLWVDKSRRSWLLKNKSAKFGEHRKLMANVWYPAAPPVRAAAGTAAEAAAAAGVTVQTWSDDDSGSVAGVGEDDRDRSATTSKNRRKAKKLRKKKVGPLGYCSPRHLMPSNSRNEV